MARHDIMPFVSEHGGHARIYTFQMEGGTTNTDQDTSWEVGEVLDLQAGGTVDYAGEGAAGAIDPATGLFYVAAASSEGLITTNNGTSGAATHAILVPVYDLQDSTQEFVTRNVYNNSDTNIGPGGSGAMTGVTVGDTCDLWVDDSTGGNPQTHVWGIDINGDHFEITRLINAEGQDLALTGEAVTEADKVVFKRRVD